MKKYFSLVKFSHTIFALPFAMLGFFLAYKLGATEDLLYKLFLVVGCMVTARNAAMSFNRLVDNRIDAQNERTKIREIPSGIVSISEARVFVLINCVLFVVFTYFLNPLSFYLSPIAILVVLGYSYTKRFTWLCHLVLGLGLGLAPVGAYISLTGQFSLLSVMYGIAVMFWVAGFDIIYALQDEEFDQDLGLHSIPSRFGAIKALNISKSFHFLSAISILGATVLLGKLSAGLHIYHSAGVIVFIGFLIYQHTLVSATDLSKINAAFFKSNGLASIIFCSLAIIDYFVYL